MGSYRNQELPLRELDSSAVAGVFNALMGSESRRWFPVAVSGLRYRSWDDDDLLVVYNKSSGDTHLLEPLAGVMLELIESAPCTSEMLAMELTDLLPDEDKDSALEVVEATLLQLRGVGLVYSSLN